MPAPHRRHAAPGFAARLTLLLLLLGLLLVGLPGATAAGPTPRTPTTVRQQFYAIHDLLDPDRAGRDVDEAAVRTAVLDLLGELLGDAEPTLQAQALTMAVDLSNRLRTREELLERVSELGYGLDLRAGRDTSNVSLLFALGIVEHARGDMRAARMWFDSTIVYHERGLAHPVIAAATKLRGYVNRDERNFAAAVADFTLADRLLTELGGKPEDRIGLHAVLAATLVDAGGDSTEALTRSTHAYNEIVANADLRERWTYAYLTYVHHAHVLEALGRYPEAIRVAEEGLALCRGRGDRSSVGYIQLKVAELELARGDYTRAESAALAALEIFRTINHSGHLAEVHECLERVFEQQPATLRRSLYHAREARRLRLELAENSRLESVFALQGDYLRTQAEHKAALAEEVAARAELERARMLSQRTSLLMGILCVCGLLAFTVYRLHLRHRLNAKLEAEVADRTAELAAQTEALAAQTEELEAKTRRLEASNQELERFAYIASHDLKTPLRSVTSFLGLIERRMPREAQPILGEFVQMAQGSARSMHALVTDVLEFSRLNSSIEDLCVPVDLRALCLGLAEQRGPGAAGAPATLRIDVLGAAELMAPPVFLQQLFGNLIDNGLKYNDSAFPKVAVEIHQTEHEVSVTVRDNGIGIAAEYHGQIFELFKRLHTSDAYAGTGLGLASCRKIVERLGGTIALESAAGEGSVFTVRLPRRCAAELKGKQLADARC